MKRLSFLILTIILAFHVNISGIRIQSAEITRYVIEDCDGNVIDSGYLGLSRVTYTNLTLDAGYTLVYTPSSNPDGYYVRKDNTMYISYKLNKSVSTVLSIRRSATTVYSSDCSGTQVSKSHKMETSDYYEVRIKNDSASNIVIESTTITY